MNQARLRAVKTVASVVLFASVAGCADTGSGAKSAASVTSFPMQPANGCDQLAEQTSGATFVMLETLTGALSVCDVVRAGKPFLPASTYKVPHALIALETGVASGADWTIAWDGHERVVAAWNDDTTLASGMTNSTVWYYQDIARDIGHERMARWVDVIDYGNEDIGPAEDLARFWLDGRLRTSALDQVGFLDRLRRQALPASIEHQQAVAEMMRIPLDDSLLDLRAKSGVVLPIDPDTGDITQSETVVSRLNSVSRVGWYVGWIRRAEEDGGDVVFALNLDIVGSKDIAKRYPLTRSMLEANGIAFE